MSSSRPGAPQVQIRRALDDDSRWDLIVARQIRYAILVFGGALALFAAGAAFRHHLSPTAEDWTTSGSGFAIEARRPKIGQGLRDRNFTMLRHFCNILAPAALICLPWTVIAQTVPQTIIACEGPDMPAMCPPASGAPRSVAAERLDIARREGLAALQAQQTMARRQVLIRGAAPTVRPPAPVHPLFQPDPYLAPVAPPDFKAAAQVVGAAISGGPHN